MNLQYIMNGSIKLFLVGLILSFSLPFNCPAEPLRYVFTQYKPANFVDAQGQPSGFFIEIIREALEKRLGIELKMEIYPWKRCQFMVQSGEADMMTTIPTEERLDYTVLVDSPIWVKNYMVYTYKDHPYLQRMDTIRSLGDLNKTAFTVISYIGNNWAKIRLKKNGIRTINAPTVESMYRMLAGQRGDLIVEDPVLAVPTLKAIGLTDRIVLTKGVTGESRFYPLISKKSSFVFLVPEFERVLNEMWKDGTITRIMKNYR